MKFIITEFNEKTYSCKNTEIEIKIPKKKKKISCKPCKGYGEWWIGDGSGRTSKCSDCNGKGYN